MNILRLNAFLCQRDQSHASVNAVLFITKPQPDTQKLIGRNVDGVLLIVHHTETRNPFLRPDFAGGYASAYPHYSYVLAYIALRISVQALIQHFCEQAMFFKL